MRIRISRIPPSDSLEGFDLRPFGFRSGGVYEVGHLLADMLVVWGYAEEIRDEEPGQAADTGPGSADAPPNLKRESWPPYAERRRSNAAAGRHPRRRDTDR